MPSIDLNADLGEGFGVWRMGDDKAMLGVVSSASVACGFHAGDPDIMARCFERAKARGVAVGAHVAFPDLAGFGRRALPMSPHAIGRAVAYQFGAARAMARYVGHEITFVKAHGALANLAETDAEIAGAIAEPWPPSTPPSTMLAIAGSAQIEACRRAKLRVAHEVSPTGPTPREGRLASREKPGAVLERRRGHRRPRAENAGEGRNRHRGRALLPTPIDSICVHGDTPHAVDIAIALREALERAGWLVSAFAPAK